MKESVSGISYWEITDNEKPYDFLIKPNFSHIESKKNITKKLI